MSLALKVIKETYPEFDLWRPPPYEYEENLMPIDILSGNDKLRKWVNNPNATEKDWDQYLWGQGDIMGIAV